MSMRFHCLSILLGLSLTATAAAAPQGPPANVQEARAQNARASKSDRQGWLDIWNDIDYRRAFAESYLPETEVEPRLEEFERDSMQEVLGAISKDRLKWAVEQLRTLIGPTSSAVFEFTLGNVHMQQQQWQEAIAAYDKAIGKHAKFRRAWKNKGICHVRLNDFRGATRAFAKVIQTGGSDALTYGLLGYSYAMIDNHVAAESAYRMAALFDPDLIDWQMGLAKSLFQQKRFAAVASLLDGMLEDNSHDGKLWQLQANAYLGMGSVGKAAENLEIVDHLGQSTADSLNTLGDIYVNQEMFELAAGAYERALGKDAGADVQKALRNAKVLIARNAGDQGKRLLEIIQTRFADELQGEAKKDMLKLKARIAMAEQSSDEQAAILEEIVALDPLDGEALILLGQHYASKNEIDRAILYYENAAAIPKFEADAKVRHAQVLVREGQYGKALPLLKRAQALDPRDDVQDWLEKVERLAAQGG